MYFVHFGISKIFPKGKIVVNHKILGSFVDE